MTRHRAPNGAGHIRQRPDGRWEISFTMPDPATGKSRRYSAYGLTQKAAREARANMEHRARIGVPVYAVPLTVGEWFDRWLTISLPASSDSESYRTQMTHLTRRHIIPSRMAGLPLQKVTPAVIEDFIKSLRALGTDGHAGTSTGRPLSDSTLRSIFMTLRRGLDVAVRDGQINTNPTQSVKAPKVAPRSVQIYAPDEVRALLTALRPSRYFPYFVLVATTGMRRGEALGLKWEDVDLRRRVVSINRTISQASGGTRVSAPKTRSSMRRVAIPNATAAVLGQWRETQREEATRFEGSWNPDGWVFTTESGTLPHPRNVLRALQVAARQAGLPAHSGVHTLRHTVATELLERGVHARAVADILGHASTQVTLDIYGHTTRPVVQEAAEHLASALLPHDKDPRHSDAIRHDDSEGSSSR